MSQQSSSKLNKENPFNNTKKSSLQDNDSGGEHYHYQTYEEHNRQHPYAVYTHPTTQREYWEANDAIPHTEVKSNIAKQQGTMTASEVRRRSIEDNNIQNQLCSQAVAASTQSSSIEDDSKHVRRSSLPKNTSLVQDFRSASQRNI